MIRALISDLGNVLLHFDHRIIAQRLAEHFPHATWNDEKEQHFWTLVKDFERGVAETDVFLREAGRLLGASGDLDEAHFHLLWGDIFWLNEEYLALIRDVKPSLRLVMLSNTNPMHIEFARERFPEVFELFDSEVFSYEIGTVKPDPGIFLEALHRAGTPAEQALYFDDIAAYVDAASAIGLHAYQYVSLQAVRDVLNMYNVPLRASS